MGLKTPFPLVLGLLLLLTACAPMRYPDGHQTAKHDAGGSAHLGEGGVVKKGKPYQIAGQWYYPLASGERYNQIGIASWYGKKFHGRKTANGETYNMYAMTAAHTTLPMPSTVLVTNLDNGKSVQVRVNDRGPFVKSRLIDLSYSAAKALGYAQQGTARVRVQTIPFSSVSQAQAEITPIATTAPVLAEPVKTPVKIPVISKRDTHQHPSPDMAYIQVGAFAAKANAVGVVGQLQQHLDASHPPLKVVSVGDIYRVRVGPFDLDEDATKALSLIQSKGYHAAMIIHD